MNKLIRFWFTFLKFESFSPMNIGCGITAYDYNDALLILKNKYNNIDVDVDIDKCIVDVDINCIDESHVIPNMGDVTMRGVWFPLS